MKPAELLTIVAGGVLTFFVIQFLARSKPVAASVPPGAQAINVTNDAGWQYFTDGTAIAPSGDYYYQGRIAWKAQP